MLKARLKRTAILSAIALVIGGGIGFYQIQNETARVTQKASSVAPMAGGAQVGGGFALIDQDGKEVTENDYAGRYKLIFFGFTFCPAVCPTELQKMARVLDQLENPNIQPIFITVDPERDTAQVMKGYVGQFHPDIVGLTGSREQIDKVLADYKVYASKVENDMMDGYMMDHSAFIYLMSPNNALITLYPAQDTAEQIAEDIKKRLNAS
ncbi:MAG TPA: SCO family protein [Rhodospirillaceae bacterium]|nr:SCO family protein [Rhodospirillaceae bacterium]